MRYFVNKVCFKMRPLLFLTILSLTVLLVAEHAESYMEVCPQIQCPNDHNIPNNCRKPNFVVGSDGRTQCRVCDSNDCEVSGYARAFKK